MKSPLPALASGLLLGLITPASGAPSDDLLGYWKLDNDTADSATGGSVNDNGSWSGGAAYTPTAPFGSGADLDGSRFVSIPSSADLVHTGGSITISAWFRVDSWSKGWQCLLSKGENSNFRIARRSNDANQISYAGGTQDIFGGAVNDGGWHHIVAISEVGTATFMYIDGQLVVQGGAPSINDEGLPLLLGENPGSTGRQWDGAIDDVALFGTALTSFQAEALYTFADTHNLPVGDAVQILDAHAAGPGGSAVIGPDTWVYEPSDTGSGNFVLLGSDGSGVDVSSGPAITSFDNSPIFINSGQSATLSWQVTPPYNSLSIDNGVGNVLPQTDGGGAGSTAVSPPSTTTYTLSATNAQGTTQRTTTVFVDADPSTPRINEFVADNAADGLLDEDGDAEDWIEIYNPGPNAADLSTFYLTDSALTPNKWAFPAVVMPPDSYLLVFASSKDRDTAGSQLHSNFKLSAGGEYLALTRDDGAGGYTVVGEFAPGFPNQEEGFSYGVAPDGFSLGYLATPTPGSANGQTSLGFVADTEFDVDRGFFSAPFTLNITTLTPDATIRYTTDGSEPTASTGTVYTGPLTISGTTILRAAAFKTGYFPTNVDTQSYLFLDDIRTQYANGAPPPGWPNNDQVNGQDFSYGMDPDITSRYTAQEMVDALSAIPSVSIATSQANLTSGSTGIYVNAGQHGIAWERPASIEFLHPDGVSPNAQSNCGIRIRGGFSRSSSNPKHALRVFFRNQYGNGKFDYPLFGGEGVDRFDKFDLRTSQNYSWAFQNDGNNTFLREVLGRDLQASMGQPYTRSRYYHLYLNGIYWGLFMTQERAEANHGEAYLGGDDANYDTIKSAGSSGGYNAEATDGEFFPGSDWHTLWTMARQQNGAQGGGGPTIARFMEMQGLDPDGSRDPALPIYLDVDNLIDYQMIIGYTGNYDAPLSDFIGATNNWYAVRDRVRDNHGFQFFVHDGEHSMGAGGRWGGANDRMNTGNGSGSRDTYAKGNPSFIHFDLEESTPEYRLRFADRAHDYLFNDGLLTAGSVLAHMEARRQIVADAIIAESARWGDSKRSDPLDEQDWNNAVNSLISTINGRRDVFLGHLRTANLYPDLAAPAYSQHGGQVAVGSTVNVFAPTGGTHVYYMIGTGDSDLSDWSDDLDPRLLGGGVNPSAGVLTISGGGGGPSTTHYIQEGDAWRYLDDGSNQGTAWRAPGFDDNGWASGASELGYGDGDETTLLNDPGSGNRPATTYFRKTVTIPDPSVFGDFEIAITYDDAYAIYVNGSQVARHPGLSANAPFDEYSTNTVGDNAIDNLSVSKSAFAAGSNTIAVEIHQTSATSSDVSFNLRLTGRPPGGGNTVTIPIPETVDSPVWIKSRTFNSGTGEWSAMNQAFFTTAPAATPADIVISEVNYHPLPPSPSEALVDPTWDQDDFEFVEVMNIGTATVDLGGAAFVMIPIGDHLEGIEFTFPQGTLIAPGQRLVVVADSAAFAARYPGVTISGDYSNRLDNTGEWITLVDSAGDVIDSFRYNDLSPWPETADGDGNSLVLNDPTSAPDPADPASWSASAAIGGSPGESDGTPFVGDPLADSDGDGGVAIVEYAQGLSDQVPSADQFPTFGVVEVAGVEYPAITFRRDPAATSATVTVEGTVDLVTWADLDAGGFLSLVSTATDPDGVPVYTYRFTSPTSTYERVYMRLSVEY